MGEIGIDISGHQSKNVDDLGGREFDYVVTVCGHADEHCPLLPPGVKKIHWPLEDPAKATGTEEEIMRKFRATREEVRARVAALVDQIRRTGIPGERT